MISATVTKKDMDTLPLNGRSTLAFARLIPGSVAPTGGSTHFNGMPGGTINPTIDGINNASNGFKSGGTSFFSTVAQRLGAMEKVTVETAGLGADAGAEGGVSLKVITRRGTDQFHGSLFEQIRNDAFNANSFFNSVRGLAKAARGVYEPQRADGRASPGGGRQCQREAAERRNGTHDLCARG